MSHFTTIKTNVTFKKGDLLVEALNTLKRDLEGFNYQYNETQDQFVIDYSPLENRLRRSNLRFINRNGVYVTEGDRWGLSGTVMDDTLNRVQVAYQQAAVNRFAATHRFSTTTQKEQNGILITARRY